jgi:hypothetical protein
VDLDTQTDSPLKAETYLSRLKPNTSFHEALDCRHPLGIYNVSAARILKKLTKCCNHMEEYLLTAPNISALHGNESKQDEVIDYIELCLYAAAEHVDDLESIARCFFKDDPSAARSPYTRKLKSDMKPIRDRISGFTNAIKHNHSRIRICSRDFEQAAHLRQGKALLVAEIQRALGMATPLDDLNGCRVKVALVILNRRKRQLRRFGNGYGGIDPLAADYNGNVPVILEVDGEYLRKFLNGILGLQRNKIAFELVHNDRDTCRRTTFDRRFIADPDVPDVLLEDADLILEQFVIAGIGTPRDAHLLDHSQSS